MPLIVRPFFDIVTRLRNEDERLIAHSHRIHTQTTNEVLKNYSQLFFLVLLLGKRLRPEILDMANSFAPFA